MLICKIKLMLSIIIHGGAKIVEKQELDTNLGTISCSIREGNPLVVLLNGFGSFDTEQSFSKIITKLPEEYGILAPDYLNSGFSGQSLKKYTIKDEAEVLADIINSKNAKKVILVAHSIGGVYAFHLQNEIENLVAIIAIEPATRQIILNPPKSKEYLEHEKVGNSVDFIRNKIYELFDEKYADQFWQTTETNSEKFDDIANQSAFNAMNNDLFWSKLDSLSDDVPIIIFTESYRQKEYENSEYFNKNTDSKIVTLGSFHYIHWEEPNLIVNCIKKFQ